MQPTDIDFDDLYQVDYDSLGKYQQCNSIGGSSPVAPDTASPLPASTLPLAQLRTLLGLAILLALAFQLSRR